MRQPRPADLPDFDDPPVVEVYLSVQFEPIVEFDAGRLNACWNELRSEFPRAKHQLVLGHELEQFGGAPAQPTPPVQLWSLEVPVRLALTSADGARLIQIQADRFVHNWRKIAVAAPYPRYEEIRERFEAYFATFNRVLGGYGLDLPRIDQCEISYINRIPAIESRGSLAGADRVFRQLQAVQNAGDLPVLEDVGVRARYVLSSNRNDPFARLHTLMQPLPSAEERAFLFSLLVRGRPAIPTTEGALDFFDLGRVTIVRAFAALTTPAMHKIWGRKDAT